MFVIKLLFQRFFHRRDIFSPVVSIKFYVPFPGFLAWLSQSVEKSNFEPARLIGEVEYSNLCLRNNNRRTDHNN